MKRLVLNMGAGYPQLLKAINVIGANQTLYVFQRGDYKVTDGVRFIGHSGNFPFQDPKPHLDRLNKLDFQEAILILTGDKGKDAEAIRFASGIQAPIHLYIHGAKPPCPTPEAALGWNFANWVSDSAGSPRNGGAKTPLYAILGAYNEEDIVYATVKHAFHQGCERVFLVDNGSQDRTVEEALSAGAELALSYETSKYFELLRIRIMNDLVERISLESPHGSIWWLWLDADEFPEGRDGATVGAMLARTPDDCRIAGASVVNHFPTSEPYYACRRHPGDFMPYGEAFDPACLKVKHCPHCHWKHPLQRFTRSAPPVRALSGFHAAISAEPLLEPAEDIVIHHFPFRDKESTLRKYAKLCDSETAGANRMSFDDSVSINGRSCIRRRYDNLLHIYNGEWDKVSIAPGESPAIGVKLSKHMTSGTAWDEGGDSAFPPCRPPMEENMPARQKNKDDEMKKKISTGKQVIELLKEKAPAFQLQSGIQELPSSEGFLAQGPRSTESLKRQSHASTAALLDYLAEIVKPGFTTIETGGGWSTCVFSACGGKHICVNPDITANRLIREFLDSNGVQHGTLEFMDDVSDHALPLLGKDIGIDVALIDGNHSFPIPVVDWHYIDPALKKGGMLLVDDTNVKSVSILCDYLSLEPSYKKVTDVGNTAVYEKVREGRVWGWADQKYNHKPSPSPKPQQTKELLNAEIIISFFTQTKRSYALFGAGKVAGQIIDMTCAKGLTPPAFVIDSASEKDALKGIPVVTPKQIRQRPPVNEVILATTCYQDKMRAEMKSVECPLNPVDLMASLLPEAALQRIPSGAPASSSETAKVRNELAKFCLGDGLDIGFGGDPILPSAITVDLPCSYANYAQAPQHLHGDAQCLRWFADESMDYIYSSHLLEDFPNTAAVIDEWLRVLRVGGRLVLFLPDEQLYRAECAKAGKPSNRHHVHADFSMKTLKAIFSGRGDVRILHEKSPSSIYSFELVVEKLK